jgi:hypothetical protein
MDAMTLRPLSWVARLHQEDIEALILAIAPEVLTSERRGLFSHMIGRSRLNLTYQSTASDKFPLVTASPKIEMRKGLKWSRFEVDPAQSP